MARVSLGVLGPLQVWVDGSPVAKLESDKVRALLVYLAVESDQPHSRDQLVGLLWPDYREQDARHSLRQALFNLRQAIGDQAADPPYLLISRDAIQFNRASDYSLDLDQFNQSYTSCEKHLSRCLEDCSIHAARLEEMVRLYRGPFLQQFFLEDSAEFEQWALVQRENLHQRTLEAHHYLAGYYELQGDYPAARRHAARQLELDPWREEAHAQLMRSLALDGQRSAALAQYETCRRVLAEELGVEPSAGTHALYEQIRSGTLTGKAAQPGPPPAVPIQNLPVQLTPFIGREQELSRLAGLLEDPHCRCLTLVGPGGIGKTRLALQAAGNQLHRFAQGAAFVPLASVHSGEAIVPAIAGAVHFSFYGPGDPEAQLINFLREKHLLLILDNLEHLLADKPSQEYLLDLLIEILQAAPAVQLLVTSRQALDLQEEWVFEVQGLPYPEGEASEGFDEFGAVALFLQRLRRVSPGYELTGAGRQAVARICRLVEGLPLALELAAAWARTLSPAEIAQEIEGSLDFLSASMRDLPERHRSIRVVFDHSWQTLSPQEQRALSQLAIFQGGFSRQAAEQVAGASLSTLSTLVNRTLLRRQAGESRSSEMPSLAAPSRYDLHELVRQYSLDRLAADPQAYAQAQQRHARFFLDLVETANQGLKGPDQVEWLGRLEQDHDNLRLALEWALKNDRASGDELALRLSGGLRWFWRMRGYFHEGRRWLTAALDQSPEASAQARAASPARAGALLGLNLLVNAMGDLSEASSLTEASAALYRELNDPPGLAEALIISGLTFVWQGQASLGCDRLEEAVQISRQAGERWLEAQSLYRLGISRADYLGDSSGRALLAESAAILESLGEKYVYVSVLTSLGIVDTTLGDYAAARSRLERSLAIAQEISHPWGIADALTNLGCVFRIQGEYALARSHFEEAQRVYREHGGSAWEIDVLCAQAENEIAQGNFSTARAHLQAASGLLESSENQWLQALAAYFCGLLAFYEGEAARSAGLLERATELARAGRYRSDLARALVTLARLRRTQGSLQEASALLEEGLDLFQKLGQKLGIAAALEEQAAIRAAQSDDRSAVTLFAAAQALRQSLGAPLPPVDGPLRAAALAASRSRLGEPAFADAWAQGMAQPP